MTPTKKRMVCVGGPRGGQRYAILHGNGFRVPLQVPSTMDDAKEPMRIEWADYREEVFHTPQGDHAIWTPNRQTAFETMAILISTYEAAPKEVVALAEEIAMLRLALKPFAEWGAKLEKAGKDAWPDDAPAKYMHLDEIKASDFRFAHTVSAKGLP